MNWLQWLLGISLIINGFLLFMWDLKRAIIRSITTECEKLERDIIEIREKNNGNQ